MVVIAHGSHNTTNKTAFLSQGSVSVSEAEAVSGQAATHIGPPLQLPRQQVGAVQQEGPGRLRAPRGIEATPGQQGGQRAGQRVPEQVLLALLRGLSLDDRERVEWSNNRTKEKKPKARDTYTATTTVSV